MHDTVHEEIDRAMVAGLRAITSHYQEVTGTQPSPSQLEALDAIAQSLVMVASLRGMTPQVNVVLELDSDEEADDAE